MSNSDQYNCPTNCQYRRQRQIDTEILILATEQPFTMPIEGGMEQIVATAGSGTEGGNMDKAKKVVRENISEARPRVEIGEGDD